MPTVTLERAQAELPDLIRELKLGEELVITENGVSVGKLTALPPPRLAPPAPGSWKGMVVIPDDDEHDESHLKDFEEYMR